MAKSSKKPELSPERLAEIRRDARSGRNWAAEEAASHHSPSGAYGANCICGAGHRTFEAAHALKGEYGHPTGQCPRHQGGTVWTPPAGLWETMKEGKRA